MGERPRQGVPLSQVGRELGVRSDIQQRGSMNGVVIGGATSVRAAVADHQTGARENAGLPQGLDEIVNATADEAIQHLSSPSETVPSVEITSVCSGPLVLTWVWCRQIGLADLALIRGQMAQVG